MKNHIYEFLYLSRQERNGLLIMIILSAVISFLPTIYFFFEKRTTTDFSVFQNEINSFLEAKDIASPIALGNQYFSKNYQGKSKEGARESVIELFPFDPNFASKEDFIRLGISSKTAQTILNFRNKGAKFFKKEDFKKVYGLKKSEYDRLEDFIKIERKKKRFSTVAENEVPKSYETEPINPISFDPNNAEEKVLLQNGIPQHVAATIIKYRNSGGHFRTKEDLKKIYTLDEAVYSKIESYIEIAPQEEKTMVKVSVQRNDFSEKKSTYENIIIDINQATPEEWQQLHGIGPSFSKRIVQFRNKLGGFYDINQVGETFGLPDSTFQNIKPQLMESAILKKINLNQATEEDLKSHPYISWNQAKLIVSYRKMHGEFKELDELLKIGPLTKEWLNKVKFYLNI